MVVIWTIVSSGGGMRIVQAQEAVYDILILMKLLLGYKSSFDDLVFLDIAVDLKGFAVDLFHVVFNVLLGIRLEL